MDKPGYSYPSLYDSNTTSFFKPGWSVYKPQYPASIASVFNIGYGVHMQITEPEYSKNHNMHVNVLIIWHRSLYMSSQVWPRLLVWDSKAN